MWDLYRPTRFVREVRVLTFKDVNVEETVPSEFDPGTLPTADVDP